MACWLELVSVENGRVRIEGHNVFTATGEIVVASSELRFRSLAALKDSLTNGGFSVEHVYGDWNGGRLLAQAGSWCSLRGAIRPTPNSGVQLTCWAL